MTITSPHNDHLKEIRKLNQSRRRRMRVGRFVAEGEDLVATADAAGWAAVERYCAAGSGLPGVEVDARLLASVSELGSGTRALAVYEERWAPAPAGPVCVYLHGVHDPGNVGTILRSAEAFGAGSVAFGPGTADPFGPKAVRASMGAVFTVPVARAATIDGLPRPTVALASGGGAVLSSLLSTQQAREEGGGSAGGEEGGSSAGGEDAGVLTLLIGAEREGLPDEVLQAADHVAHIPIVNHSLNAAMAATVALYEVSRMARR